METILTLAQTTLAQNTLFGISVARLVAWLLFALVILLALLLIRRFIRWVLGTGQMVNPRTTAQLPPTAAYQGTESRPLSSLFRDEVSGLDATTPLPPTYTSTSAASSSILDADFNQPLEEIDSRVRITDRSEIEMPEPVFQVSSSEASRRQYGRERSWTDRSLFGKPIAGAQQELPRIEPGQVPFADQSDYQFGQATPALAALLPESDNRKQAIKHELVEAGYFNPHAYENLAAVRYLGLMLPIIVFGLLLVLGPPEFEPVMLVLLIVGAIAGWSLPRLFVRSRAAKRRREIEQSLPDVIDLLNMCVSQGMTLRSGLNRVAWEVQETYPAMSEELRIVTQQANLGTIDHALLNMNERVDVPELHSLSTLLIQTERMGTNVSDSLTEYSDGMRATLQQRADQKANAATFKLLFPTVLCLMPAVYFFLLGPAVVELSDFFQQGGLDRYRQVQINRPEGNR